MKALTAAEIREVDRLTTERYGIPSLQLMENAGRKAADAVRRTLAGRGDVRVCVLCGKGNNGGDGFVVARYLKEAGLPTRVILFGRREDVRGDAGTNLARWVEIGGELEVVEGETDWERLWPGICASNVIVDAMLGAGLRGGATGTIKEAIEKKLFTDLRDVVKITTSTKTPDAEQLKRINQVVDRLVSEQGYTTESANELLKYVGALLNR